MTRDVMAFVASEQPEFQESHKRLTAVLHGQAPDSHGVQQAMLDRFRHAGFTAQEMAKLESAHTQITELGKTEKIGRASCRERGCQYVSISVVDVSLKKKKKKK